MITEFLTNIMLRSWYQKRLNWLSMLLLPFSAIFYVATFLRRRAFKWQWLTSYKMSVPIVVVGNITVGGTGKTPFTIWLYHYLQQRGFKPAIVTRGVGGRLGRAFTHQVTVADQARDIGDEACLLFKETQGVVVIAQNRVKAAIFAEVKRGCNIIICDDGLQHYRLQRDIEIVMVDRERQYGNGLLLPAGPLRESTARLAAVDLIIENGIDVPRVIEPQIPALGRPHRKRDKQQVKRAKQQRMKQEEKNMFMLQFAHLVSVATPTKTCSLQEVIHKKVHALAAIGNPQRFFKQLLLHEIDIIPHSFPDHYQLRRADIYFADDLPVLMTAKDAVKCQAFASARHWYVATDASINASLQKNLAQLMLQKLPRLTL